LNVHMGEVDIHNNVICTGGDVWCACVDVCSDELGC